MRTLEQACVKTTRVRARSIEPPRRILNNRENSQRIVGGHCVYFNLLPKNGNARSFQACINIENSTHPHTQLKVQMILEVTSSAPDA